MATKNSLSLHIKALVLIIFIAPSFQLSSTARTGFDRAVQKISAKLRQVGSTNSDSNKREKGVLVVDGNNVRGIAKFEWGPLELMSRVSKFCQDYNLNGVVVWDHGHQKYADLYLDNLTLIFSGLSRRADDIIVKESVQLASFCGDCDKNNSNAWSSLAFVTNDGELQHRIKKSSSIIHDHATEQNNADNTKNHPLVVDSTRFVALISQIEYETVHVKEEEEVSKAVLEAERTLRRHSEIRRTRYNPRREVTWQRCVLAEAMCSALRQRSISPMDRDHNSEPLPFAIRYVRNLQERGYRGPTHQSKKTGEDESPRDRREIKKTIHGPSRLDKRQRRQLQNYNQALQNGRLAEEDGDKK